MNKFEKGDRIRLIKPFRCSGDEARTDRDIDKRVRDKSPNPDEPEGVVTDPAYSEEWVEVEFDGHGTTLYINNDCIELALEPASPEEISAAIKSILGSN